MVTATKAMSILLFVESLFLNTFIKTPVGAESLRQRVGDGVVGVHKLNSVISVGPSPTEIRRVTAVIRDQRTG